MININMQDLTWLISHAVDVGVQEYMKGVDPILDKVSELQAERFVVSRGYKEVMIKKWKETGLLHPVKSGEAQNSPRYYSLAELWQVMCIVKANSLRSSKDTLPSKMGRLIPDDRTQCLVRHSYEEMVCQRVNQILSGYAAPGPGAWQRA